MSESFFQAMMHSDVWQVNLQRNLVGGVVENNMNREKAEALAAELNAVLEKHRPKKLTHEQIQKLSGRDLDRELAKALGWRDLDLTLWGVRPGEKDYRHRVPEWWCDLGSTWLLYEPIAQQHRWALQAEGADWAVTAVHFSGGLTGGHAAFMVGKTAAEAMARAVLLAKVGEA